MHLILHWATHLLILLTLTGCDGHRSSGGGSPLGVVEPTEGPQGREGSDPDAPAEARGAAPSAITVALRRGDLASAEEDARAQRAEATAGPPAPRGQASLTLAKVYGAAGHYEAAIAEAALGVELLRKSASTPPALLVQALSQLAHAQLDGSDVSGAEETLGEAMALGETAPLKAADLAETWVHLAAISHLRGDLSAAQQRLDDALSLLPPASEAQAQALAQRAQLRFTLGRFSDAEDDFRGSLRVWEALEPPDLVNAALTRSALGQFQSGVGQSAEGFATLTDASATLQARLPEGHPERLMGKIWTQIAIGAGGDVLGALDRIAPLLPLLEAALPEDQLSLSLVLTDWGYLLAKAGRFPESEAAIERGIAIATTRLGPASLPKAYGIAALAEAQMIVGRHTQSEQSLTEALEMLDALGAEEDRSIGPMLGSLAAAAIDGGRFEDGYIHLERALPIILRVYGPDHPYYGTCLNNMAGVLRAQARYEESAATLEEVLRIHRGQFGDVHFSVGLTLNNLGQVYADQGRYEDAARLLIEASEVWTASMGPDYVYLAHCWQNLARARMFQGRLAEAEALALKTLDHLNAQAAPSPFSLAVTLQTLAQIQYRSGHYEASGASLAESLALLRGHTWEGHEVIIAAHTSEAMLSMVEGRYDEAEALLKKSEGLILLAGRSGQPSQWKVAQTRMALAWRQDLRPAALATAKDALEQGVEAWYAEAPILSSTTLWVRLDRVMTPAAAVLSVAGADADAAAYRAALVSKGLVLEQEMMRRMAAASDEDTRALFEAYHESVRVFSAISRERAPRTQNPAQIEVWQRERRAREEATWDVLQARQDALVDHSGPFGEIWSRRGVGPEEIARSLPMGSTLVDFVVYQHKLPSALPDAPEEARLNAFVLSAEGALTRVDLGPWAPIEAALQAWRETLIGRPRQLAASIRLQRAHDVSQAVWAPLKRALGDTRRVMISPDRGLASLPWASLPSDETGAPLLDTLEVAIVPTPRLMGLERTLRGSVPDVPETAAPPSALILSGVDYGATSALQPDRADAPFKVEDILGRASRGTRPEGGWRLESGMATEGERVEALFRTYAPEVSLAQLRGEAATEGGLAEAVLGRRWIHIATHGYYEPNLQPGGPSAEGGWREAVTLSNPHPVGRPPELRVGLVLAGANRDANPQEGDGLLSAWEIASLDMSGVDLAVLAACQTATGEITEGEGMLSLQRALMAAGVGSSITSLWPVDDGATLVLMERFYRDLLLSDLPPPEALTHSLRWLKGPQGVAALKEAGAFLPDSDGALHPALWSAWVVTDGGVAARVP